MTEDLVKRLRQIGEGAYVGAVSDDRKTAKEAADRIEKLEVELVRTFNNMMKDAKRIETLEVAQQQIAYTEHEDKYWPGRIARKALEGK